MNKIEKQRESDLLKRFDQVNFEKNDKARLLIKIKADIDALTHEMKTLSGEVDKLDKTKREIQNELASFKIMAIHICG